MQLKAWENYKARVKHQAIMDFVGSVYDRKPYLAVQMMNEIGKISAEPIRDIRYVAGELTEYPVKANEFSGTIAVPMTATSPSLFAACFRGLQLPQNTLIVQNMGSSIIDQRNKLAVQIKGKWTLWIDSDMAFEPHSLEQLLKAWRAGAKIVGGLCYRKDAPFTPTTHFLNPDGKSYGHYDVTNNGVVEVDATGLAFLLVDNEVFEKMPRPWFESSQFSEDITFCRKAKELGYSIWVDTDLKIGHLTQFPVGVAQYHQFVELLKKQNQMPVSETVHLKRLVTG